MEKVAPLDAANSQRYWLGATHNVRVSISGKEGQEKLLVIFSLWEERDTDLIIVSSLLWYNATTLGEGVVEKGYRVVGFLRKREHVMAYVHMSTN